VRAAAVAPHYCRRAGCPAIAVCQTTAWRWDECHRQQAGSYKVACLPQSPGHHTVVGASLLATGRYSQQNSVREPPTNISVSADASQASLFPQHCCGESNGDARQREPALLVRNGPGPRSVAGVRARSRQGSLALAEFAGENLLQAPKFKACRPFLDKGFRLMWRPRSGAPHAAPSCLVPLCLPIDRA
jgi:hypothetical protein